MKIEKLEKLIGTKIYVDTYEELGKKYNMTHGAVRYRKLNGYELTKEKRWGINNIIHKEYNDTPQPKTSLDVYIKRIKRGYDFKIAIDPTIDLRKKIYKLI